MKRPVLFWLLAGVLLLGACSGGGDPATSPTGGPTTTAATGPPEDCDDQSAKAKIEIEMRDSFFDPDCVVMTLGSEVAVVNAGATVHSFTVQLTDADQDLTPGSDLTLTFGDNVVEGEWFFFCKYHSGMNGTLWVVEE